MEELYQKYIDGCASDAEKRILFQWLREADDADLAMLADRYLQVQAPAELADLAGDTDRIWRQIRTRIGTAQAVQPAPVRLFRRWRWLATAAAVLIVAMGGYYIFEARRQIASQQLGQRYGDEVAPGGNKATLRLSDGTIVQLAENKSEIRTDGSFYTYEDGQQLGENSDAATFATLATPRGGQYRVVLPDGTKVWLNAATSLRYPVRFEGQHRRVELDGEAYFEVAKDRTKPFIVQSSKQEITVTGTAFNISTYNDEPVSATTLVEGQVRIADRTSGKTAVLVPGQQAITDGVELSVLQVDPTVYSAWKEDYFVFESMPLPAILKQLSRWYDVEVDYAQVPRETLSARVRRDKNISSVLQAISKTTGINLYIKERRIMLRK